MSEGYLDSISTYRVAHTAVSVGGLSGSPSSTPITLYGLLAAATQLTGVRVMACASRKAFIIFCKNSILLEGSVGVIMIKRYVCFTLTLFLLIAFASCAKQPDPIQNDEDYFILPEPDIPILELFSSDDSNPLGFSMEEDYSMIRASTEKSVYPTDFEK